MVKLGIKKLIGIPKFRTWPPSAIEFYHLCQPSGEDYGLPEDDEAFRQAVGISTGKHPGVVYMLRQPCFDVHSFRLMDDKRARKYFSEHWAQVVKDVAAGVILPEPEKQIAKEHHKADSEVAASNLAEIRKSL